MWTAETIRGRKIYLGTDVFRLTRMRSGPGGDAKRDAFDLRIRQIGAPSSVMDKTAYVQATLVTLLILVLGSEYISGGDVALRNGIVYAAIGLISALGLLWGGMSVYAVFMLKDSTTRIYLDGEQVAAPHFGRERARATFNRFGSVFVIEAELYGGYLRLYADDQLLFERGFGQQPP